MGVGTLFGGYSGSLLIAPGDGFGNPAGTTPSTLTYLLPGFGVEDERTAEVTAFSSPADAAAYATTTGFATYVFNGIHEAPNPGLHNYLNYPYTKGGIWDVVARMDASAPVNCAFHLWYAKNYNGDGFTAGQVFEITAGTNFGYMTFGPSTVNGSWIAAGYSLTVPGQITANSINYTAVNGATTVQSSSAASNILTINANAHGLKPGQKVQFSGFANSPIAATINANQYVVLTATTNSFTIYQGSSGTYSTTPESGASLKFVGWYPDYGDLIIVGITIPAGGSVTNLQFATQWVD